MAGHSGAAAAMLSKTGAVSYVGGMEIPDVCRSMLRHPLLAGFTEAHQLGFVDTQREQVANLLADTGFAPGSSPVVAVADWPSSYHRRLGPYMHKLAARWREFGLDAHACHIGQLKTHDGRVWLRGRPVDIIYRVFLIEHMLEPGGPGPFRTAGGPPRLVHAIQHRQHAGDRALHAE